MNISDQIIDQFLNMLWLRPENVIFDITKYSLSKSILDNCSDILEIGTGNGFFSFMLMGGEFKPEFDWYYNIDSDGFWNNKDVYDTKPKFEVSNFIKNPSVNKIKLAVDHKENLLIQAKSLGFINEHRVVDANKNFHFDGIKTVFSNIFYWLDDPIEVIKKLDNSLDKGSKVILLFPNDDFLKYCSSYKRDNNLQVLLNRGRANDLMWSMNISDFEKKITKVTNFKINKFEKYLSKLTLQTWDVGFRPFNPHLVKMANSLNASKRFEVKQEWNETAKKFIIELMGNEIDKGHKEGGFNFVVLEK